MKLKKTKRERGLPNVFLIKVVKSNWGSTSEDKIGSFNIPKYASEGDEIQVRS
jgi:hypothetical protein